MTEEPLDLRRVLRAFRRRWVTVFLLFALGLAGGLLGTVLRPPSYVARSGVLLPPSAEDAQGRPLRNIDTQVSIAGSAEILERAGSVLNPPASSTTLGRRVDVRALSVDILEIRAEASTPREAALVANAVAAAYVAYSNDATADQAGGSIAVLQDQAARLEEEIRDLDEEIATSTGRIAGMTQLSPERAREEAVRDALRGQQVQTSRQLSSVNNRISDARLESELSRRGLRVLEPATTPRSPSRPRLLLNTSMGGLGGLLAGALLALVREGRDHRLRRRDEVAEAVGAPVLASVAVPVRKRVKEYRHLLTRWVPNAVESLAMRQVFTRLGLDTDEPPANIVVVTLPDDRAGLGFTVELAAFATTIGTPTALVVATNHHTAGQLRSASSGLLRRVRSLLSVHRAIAGIEARDLRPAELTVIIVVADDGPLVLPTWGRRTHTMLAVSSGFATAEMLASTALTWLDAGYPLSGVVVVNPEPSDPTTGRLGWVRTTNVEGRAASARRARELSSEEPPAVRSEPIGQAT